MKLLEVSNLSFTYPPVEDMGIFVNVNTKQNKRALEDISFSIPQGQFTVVCGSTGSGKSTLLRMLKRELTPRGSCEGTVLFCGKKLEELSASEAASEVGFVAQRPEQQLVTDKVWHELSFGLENLGIPRNQIAHRIAEMAAALGIDDWFEQPVAQLSGGQKAILNLAAVMVMHPKLLILDEPTAQLDPVAASEYLRTLQKLNRELGLTVIIAEHRLEEVVPMAGQLLVLEQGRLVADCAPRDAAHVLAEQPQLLCGMPAALRLYGMLTGVRLHGALETSPMEPSLNEAETAGSLCPLTIQEGRAWVEENFENRIRMLADRTDKKEKANRKERVDGEEKATACVQLKHLYFRYAKELPDVLEDLSLEVRTGEALCILGSNGSGKSTALGAIAGLNRCYAGDIRIFGKRLKEYKNQSLYRECLTMLPQDVQTLFLANTVREELKNAGILLQDAERTAQEYQPLAAVLQHLNPLLDKHPYDLSGGEQQLLALALVLATRPRLLLLDEPTKGLDAYAKQEILQILRSLKRQGVTIVLVTHDIEFAAEFADRCAMFFRGQITSVSEPGEFFNSNYFYTTAANRIARGYYEGVVTVEELVKLCRANRRV